MPLEPAATRLQPQLCVLDIPTASRPLLLSLGHHTGSSLMAVWNATPKATRTRRSSSSSSRTSAASRATVAACRRDDWVVGVLGASRGCL